MRKLTVLLTLLVVLAFVGSALAIGPGKTVEFAGGAQGKVVFDGKVHADKGNKCNDCHPKLFQMKKGTAKITKAEHEPGKMCGNCHDGKKAFAVNDDKSCGKCHKK